MPPKKEAPVKGLRLTDPGVPPTLHSVSGIRGLYCTAFATPVGGPGEPGLERAKEFDKNPSAPLELVDMTPAEADEARTRIKDHRTQGAAAFRDALNTDGLAGEIAREEAANAAGGKD